MKVLYLFFCVIAALITTSHGDVPNPVHPLRPQSGSAGRRLPGIDCLSWRLAVETDNIQKWKLVPLSCENYVGHYMLGGQYRRDCEMATEAAYMYAKNVTLAKDGKDAWVFDIDETALSNLPYYARPDVAFG